MATKTGPDLTVARKAVEALMDDTCVVTRPGSKTFNPATGRVTTSLGPTLYEGRCSLKPRNSVQDRIRREGDQTIVIRLYDMTFPWNVPEFLDDDVVTMTSSRRDPAIPGLELRVRDYLRSTMLVSRKVSVEGRSRAD